MKIQTEDCVKAIVEYFENKGGDLTDAKAWKRLSKTGSGNSIKRSFQNKKTGDVVYVMSTETEILSVSENDSNNKIITKFDNFKKPTVENSLKNMIKDSKLSKVFKDELISGIKDMIDNDEDYVICELDACMDFLKKSGFKTWNLSNDEDLKLENYLKKYFSDNLKNFSIPITTEDYVVLYEPNKSYNYNVDQLPQKLPKNDTNLFILHLSLLGDPYKHGRQNFSSRPISKDDCEKIKEAFLDKDFDTIQSLFTLFNDNKSNFDAKIKKIKKDIQEFTLDPPRMRKATNEDIFDELENQKN